MACPEMWAKISPEGAGAEDRLNAELRTSSSLSLNDDNLVDTVPGQGEAGDAIRHGAREGDRLGVMIETGGLSRLPVGGNGDPEFGRLHLQHLLRRVEEADVVVDGV